MLRIYGPNSIRKLLIAQTIFLMCAYEGFLTASFFFSLSVTGLNTEKHLMAILVYQIKYQMSLLIPESRRYIAQAVESDTLAFRGSLKTQFTPIVCGTGM